MDSAGATETLYSRPLHPPTHASPPDRATPILRLCWILARARFLQWKNGILRAPRRTAPRTLALAGLVLPLAYLGLFADSFARIARITGPQTQRAVLAVVVVVLCCSSLFGRIVAGQAVRAGSSENAFFLAHPISLARLMLARALAAAVFDPWGALFLLPIVLAASAVWQAGVMAVPVALALSLVVQVLLAALAQTVQIVLVYVVPAAHRRLLWTVLGLLSVLSTGALWIMAALIVRRTETFLAAFAPWVQRFDSAPLCFLSQPVYAAARGDGAAALVSLVGLLGLAVLVLSACALAGRWAGHRGWEDAEAPGTEGVFVPHLRTGAGPALSIARRELLALVRDRPRLVMLLALPGIFVGVQWVMFGGGFSGSIARNTVVAYSLAVYLAAFGPLPHMQAERGTFWLLRSVPQPLGRLFLGKLLAWTLIAAVFSGIVFCVLCWAMPAQPDATSMSRIQDVFLGLLRLWFGTTCVVLLAIGLGSEGADLTRSGRSALGPGTVYLFLLIAGLFNLALYDTSGFPTAGALFLLCAALYWQSGIVRAERSLDPEAMADLAPSAGEGAMAALLWALGAHATRLGTRDPLLPSIEVWIWMTVLGSLVGLRLVFATLRRAVGALRARRFGPFRSLVRIALGMAIALALAAILPESGRKAWLVALSADAGSPWAIASVCVAREIVFRALLQRALGQLAVPVMPRSRWSSAIHTIAVLMLTALCGALAEPALGPAGVVAVHVVPGVLFSLAGSWLPALALELVLLSSSM